MKKETCKNIAEQNDKGIGSMDSAEIKELDTDSMDSAERQWALGETTRRRGSVGGETHVRCARSVRGGEHECEREQRGARRGPAPAPRTRCACAHRHTPALVPYSTPCRHQPTKISSQTDSLNGTELVIDFNIT